MAHKNEPKINKLLEKNTEEVIEKSHLKEALLSGARLRIKHGIDPTSPQIHIGRAVSLWKLRDFQELGHQVVLIIGDFTAQIGDASDKTAMRRPLSVKEIQENMRGYVGQLGKILDVKKTEFRYNSEWLGKLRSQELLSLATHFSVQQLIQRRNFKERWDEYKTIGLHEILYPLLQGFDSVAVKADVEIGGSDQLFNLQAGREIQRIYGQKPQDIMTLRMVLGTDGRKMSSSWGNVINITSDPRSQFGKIMALRDELIPEYMELCSGLPTEEVKKWEKQLKLKNVNPKDAKVLLGEAIVCLYHGKAAAEAAAKEFSRVFREKQLPSNLPEIKIKEKKLNLVELLVKIKCVESKGEAKRVIKQKGVKIDGRTHDEWKEQVGVRNGMVVNVGKKKFVKIVT